MRYLCWRQNLNEAAETDGTSVGGLPNDIKLAVGMEVVVAFNVSTDFGIANGDRTQQ